jgi:hypothetical protein
MDAGVMFGGIAAFLTHNVFIAGMAMLLAIYVGFSVFEVVVGMVRGPSAETEYARSLEYIKHMKKQQRVHNEYKRVYSNKSKGRAASKG